MKAKHREVLKASCLFFFVFCQWVLCSQFFVPYHNAQSWIPEKKRRMFVLVFKTEHLFNLLGRARI